MFFKQEMREFVVEYDAIDEYGLDCTAVDFVNAHYAVSYGNGVKFYVGTRLVGYYPHIRSMNDVENLIDDEEDDEEDEDEDDEGSG